ncbi:unnamed protein product, partial [Mesorhabditis spiculigera]
MVSLRTPCCRLPLEVETMILSNMTSGELVCQRLDTVNKRFRDMVRRILAHRTVFDTTLPGNSRLCYDTDAPSGSSDLRRLALAQFPYTTHLHADLGSLRILQHHAHGCLSSLQSISVDIHGDGELEQFTKFSPILEPFDELVNECIPASRLVHISLTIHLDSKKSASLCQVRELARCLHQRATDYACWEVTFRDTTKNGQKWYSPVELCGRSDEAAVIYLRAFEQLGIRITRLHVIDALKGTKNQDGSPRTLYMWNEYKRCQELSMDCDIGLLGMNYRQGPQLDPILKTVHLEQCNVAYIAEFIDYLAEDTALERMRVVAPANLATQLPYSKLPGCPIIPNLATFRAESWSKLLQLVPHLEFSLQNGVPKPKAASCAEYEIVPSNPLQFCQY